MNMAFHRFMWINEGRHGEIIRIFRISYFPVFSHRLSHVLPLCSFLLFGDILLLLAGQGNFTAKDAEDAKMKKRENEEREQTLLNLLEIFRFFLQSL